MIADAKALTGCTSGLPKGGTAIADESWNRVLPRLMEQEGTAVVDAGKVSKYVNASSPESLGLPWPYSEMDDLPEIRIIRLSPGYYAVRIDD